MNIEMSKSEGDTLVNFFDYLQLNIKYLFSRKIFIIIISILFSLTGFIFVYFTKQTYQATITFVAESNGGDKLGSYAGIAAQFGIDLSGAASSAFEGENLLEIFRSRLLIESTLKSKKSDGNSFLNDYVVNHKMITKANEKLFFSSTNTRFSDSLSNEVYKKIVTEQLYIDRKDKKVTLIVLQMVDISESFAKEFIEKLCLNTIEYYTNYKTKKTYQNLSILQVQADSLNKVINNRIFDVASINDLNVNPLKQIIKVPSQRKNVDLTVASAVYTEVLKQLEIAKISFRKESPLIQIIDTPKYPLKKMRMGKLFSVLLFFSIGFLSSIVYLLFKNAYSKLKLDN